MRNHKFRYIVRHKYSGNVEIKIYSLNQIEERPLKELSPAFLADYELLGRDEFTGLKDKNGTEIYEGDIVELGTKERFYVAWHDYKQEFTFRGYGGGYYPNTYRGATRDDEYGWKVIGNIHEHSHLLEDAT